MKTLNDFKTTRSEIREHNRIHRSQYWEMFGLGTCLWTILICIFSAWWFMLLIPFTYYIMFVVEYIVLYIKIRGRGYSVRERSVTAYRSVSFEKEARLNQGKKNYTKYRPPLSHFNYYGLYEIF